MKREFSAGGIVCKKILDPRSKMLETRILLRRPTPSPEYRGNLGWSLPKGLIDEGESLEVAALREVREEAGVEAKIVKKMKALKIMFKSGGDWVMKFVTYFVMEWVSDRPEGFGWETAEIKWVSKEEALKLMVFANEKKLIEEALG